MEGNGCLQQVLITVTWQHLLQNGKLNFFVLGEQKKAKWNVCERLLFFSLWVKTTFHQWNCFMLTKNKIYTLCWLTTAEVQRANSRSHNASLQVALWQCLRRENFCQERACRKGNYVLLFGRKIAQEQKFWLRSQAGYMLNILELFTLFSAFGKR